MKEMSELTKRMLKDASINILTKNVKPKVKFFNGKVSVTFPAEATFTFPVKFRVKKDE